jgi:radical SAM protein with 4Fe4S-binding SPASM domain
MTSKNNILREEHFGGVIYERENISYRFLSIQQTLDMKTSDEEIDIRSPKESPQKGIISAPIRVYYEITRKCNLRCPHCFTSSGQIIENELTIEEHLKVIDGLRKDNVIEVRITGGEPTQRKGWDTIVGYALQRGLVTVLNTNGVYNDKVRKKIADLEIDQVDISLDGPRYLHDSIRGKGTFDSVLETIKYLCRRNTRVRVNTLLTPHILPYMEEVIATVEGFCDQICFLQMKPIGRGEDSFASLPSTKEICDADRKIKGLREKYPHIRISAGYNVVPDKMTLLDPDTDLTSCAAGLRACNIDSTGNIYACGFQEELGLDFSLGNIKSEGFSLLNIWYNSAELSSFRMQSLEKTQFCQTCRYYKKPCLGSCIVMNQYKLLKSPTKRDPYCYGDLITLDDVEAMI